MSHHNLAADTPLVSLAELFPAPVKEVHVRKEGKSLREIRREKRWKDFEGTTKSGIRFSLGLVKRAL